MYTISEQMINMLAVGAGLQGMGYALFQGIQYFTKHKTEHA